MKKPLIRALDFIRVISTYGIVIFHFSCHQTIFRPLHTYANGSWGDALVTVFFILSGFSLAYHHSASMSRNGLKTYLIKRWKSIFPMYYIAYACVEIFNMYTHRSVFFRGNPLKYVFTLIGMDGYLSQTFPTTYNLGEWFTGAIIVLYILFPLLLRAYHFSRPLTAAGVMLLYALTYGMPLINPEPYWSIPSCLISFALGVFLADFQIVLKDVRCIALCALGFAVFCFIKLPVSSNVGDHITGAFLFVVLYAIGEKLTTFKRPAALCACLSRISYGIFLTHHVAILHALAIWYPQQRMAHLGLLLLLLVLITTAAFILTHITAKVMRMVSVSLSRRNA